MTLHISLHITCDLCNVQVCVYKAQGDMRAAALEIQKILKLMYGDASLWLELADIHMNLGDYQVLMRFMSSSLLSVF